MARGIHVFRGVYLVPMGSVLAMALVAQAASSSLSTQALTAHGPEPCPEAVAGRIWDASLPPSCIMWPTGPPTGEQGPVYQVHAAAIYTLPSCPPGMHAPRWSMCAWPLPAPEGVWGRGGEVECNSRSGVCGGWVGG